MQFPLFFSSLYGAHSYKHLPNFLNLYVKVKANVRDILALMYKLLHKLRKLSTYMSCVYVSAP